MPHKNLEKIITETVEENGFELVEIKKEIRNKLSIIKTFIDKDGGVTVKDCTSISRKLNDMFYVHDLFPGNYRLEVSSPGIDRVLKNASDFKRQLKRNIRLEYKDNDGSKTFEGKLLSVDDEEIKLESEKKTTILKTDKIISGKVILPW